MGIQNDRLAAGFSDIFAFFRHILAGGKTIFSPLTVSRNQFRTSLNIFQHFSYI